MKILATDGLDERMIQDLGRRLDLPIVRASGDGADRHIVVCGGPVPDDLLGDPRTVLLVLVEPDLPERDRIFRKLAARSAPALTVIEGVASGIVAERTWALLLNLAHGVHTASRLVERAETDASSLVTGESPGGSWLAFDPAPGVRDMTLGFLGFRSMAWSMSRLAAEAGMRVGYWPQPGARDDTVETEKVTLETGALEKAFDVLLASSHYIVLDLDFSDDTIRLIDAPELAIMKPGTHLINTTHSRAIDEGALLQALRDRHLAGVALDRFNFEPLPSDSPLRDIECALLTPGIVRPSDVEVAAETARRVAGAIATWEPSIQPRAVHHIRRKPAELGRRRKSTGGYDFGLG